MITPCPSDRRPPTISKDATGAHLRQQGWRPRQLACTTPAKDAGYSAALWPAGGTRKLPFGTSPVTRAHAAASRRSARINRLSSTWAVKVPYRITIYFWIIKILSTAMGEATSDFLAHAYSPVLAGVVGGIAFVAAMIVQFSTRRYNAWAYWFAVAMVAVFGTMAADGLHIELKVPYIDSTMLYLVALAVIFAVWQRTEGTLSIHSISTPRREAFYWATVLATFALGTAAGDLTATTFRLGYFSSGLMFAGLFLVPALALWIFDLNEILAFWVAYVLTRPLGASFADWMGVPRSLGGLNMGRGVVAIVLAIPMVALIAWVAITRPDVDNEVGTTSRPSGRRLDPR